MEETVPLPPRPAYSTIAGILLDKETGEPVVSASVIAQGTSLGNITNQNGEFRLNLPDSLRRCMLSFSHLGYVGQTVEASALEGRSNVLSLEPKVISLQEVLIRLVEPKKLLREMIEHRDRNCSTSPVYLTTFYREGGRSAVGHHEESSRLPLAGIRRGTLYLYFGRHRIGGRPYCQRRLF